MKKISERAQEKLDEFWNERGSSHYSPQAVAKMTTLALACALDEYQAEVEARLLKFERERPTVVTVHKNYSVGRTESSVSRYEPDAEMDDG